MLPTVAYQASAIGEIIDLNYASIACSAIRTHHEHVALLTVLCLVPDEADIQQCFSLSKDNISSKELYSRYLYKNKLPNNLKVEHERLFGAETFLSLSKAPDYLEIFKNYKDGFNKYTHPSKRGCVDVSMSMAIVLDIENQVKNCNSLVDDETLNFMKKRGIENENSVIEAFLFIPITYYGTIAASLGLSNETQEGFLTLKHKTSKYMQSLSSK